MGLLAYDPQHVDRLRQKLAEASLDLRGVRCTDPAAADAMRTVRCVVEQLDATWLPLVDRLLDSDPLSGRVRKVLGFGALDQSLVRVMAEGYGWAVQFDPLADDTAVVTAEEARALGAMLNTVETMALADDPEQLAWLAQQLAVIGRDPAFSAEFLANFHNWDVLPYVFAEQRAYSFKSEYTGATTPCQLDPVFDGLMTIWKSTLPVETLRAGTSATVDALLPPMNEQDPYAQALMLRSLQLDPTTLATVTNELLRRWLDIKQSGPGSIDLQVRQGPNVADLLLPRIAENATASADFLSLIEDRPALLFQTLEDPDTGYRLALAGTDPAHSDSDDAGRAVLSILEYFRTYSVGDASLDNDGHPGDYGPFLGQLVAPWLLQFTGANDEWEAKDQIKAQLLAVALDDEDALKTLTAASARITDGFAHSLATSQNDDDMLTLSLQVGGLLSLLGQLVINEHVGDQREQTHFLWDLTWKVLNTALSYVPLGTVGGAAAGKGSSALENAMAPYFLGPTEDEVRRDGEGTMDAALTVGASVMLAALFQSWQSDGRIGRDATPPPLPNLEEGCASSEYRDEVEKWIGQLPEGAGGDLGLAAGNLASNFIGRSQADEHCAELTF